MIEIENASSLIEQFEKIYKRKVYRFPFNFIGKKEFALLMVKCNNTYISLPYLSQGIVETNPPKFDFQTLSNNWQIRDTIAHSDFIYSDKVNFEIDLQQGYFYTSDIRRKIRKAQLNGVIIKQGVDKNLINDFYKVYTKRMHQKGVPAIYKRQIIRKINSNSTILFVAYKDNKPIGSASIDKITDFYFENNIFATLSSENKNYTSYLLHYSMINYCKENNAKTYSFGRCTKDSSVYNFKKHFKAKEIPLYWSSSHKTTSIRNNKWFFSLWKCLPYRLTILLGGLIHERIY
ncbi:hypothetical protein SDC9_25690 [bioreactor metagenome]|uniref:BioF2-like acetyltransferase domain-containing protein n=1 Tax=bioreactor metagenome TaxID=1076179 RepID=A0A644ULG4_9ZZZZ